MKLNSKQVQKHFEKVPKQWDALYSHENKLKYAINKWLRRGLFKRYELTFKYCGDLTGAKVLDIGCGTGRFSIECATRGAARVVGIDFAQSMIEYSKNAAQRLGFTEKCEFICGDFLSHPFDESFDIVLALGFFEYTREPGPIFKKIASLKPHKFMASFPKFTPFWGIQRYIRYYWIRRCPIYNYTRKQLEDLYQQAKFVNYEILPGQRGFFGVASAV